MIEMGNTLEMLENIEVKLMKRLLRWWWWRWKVKIVYEVVEKSNDLLLLLLLFLLKLLLLLLELGEEGEHLIDAILKKKNR